nr:hypothetical protein [Tanacetum cinerariifolium]
MFAEVHNLVVFLSKPTKSEGFGQIFWTTAKARTIIREAQIHAKVIIFEASIRRDLQFGDKEGVDCLPTATIFEQLGSAIPTDPHHTLIILQSSSSQPQKTQKPRKVKRKNTQVPQLSGPTKSVADEDVYKELDDSLVRAVTTASSLEAEHDSGGVLKCQEAMRDTIAQTKSKRVSKLSNESLLTRGNTLQSDKDSMKLNELMKLCTTLQSRVLDLEKIKTTQALEIDSLKRRVKKLEKKQRSRTHKLKRLYKVGLSARVESSDDNEDLGEDASKQGRISDIDTDKGITLVSTHDDAKMFDVDKDLHGEEVFVAKQDKNVVEKKMMLLKFNAALHGWCYKVFITTIEEEYDKMFNHLDMLNALFERKVFTCTEQVKPYLVLRVEVKIAGAKLILLVEVKTASTNVNAVEEVITDAENISSS